MGVRDSYRQWADQQYNNFLDNQKKQQNDLAAQQQDINDYMATNPFSGSTEGFKPIQPITPPVQTGGFSFDLDPLTNPSLRSDTTGLNSFLNSIKKVVDPAIPYVEKGLDVAGRGLSGITNMFEAMAPDSNRTFDQSINPFSRAIEGFQQGYNDPNSTSLGKEDAAWRSLVGNSIDPRGPLQDPFTSIQQGWNNPETAPDYRTIANDFLTGGKDIPYLSGLLGFGAGLTNPINKIALEAPKENLQGLLERVKKQPEQTPVPTEQAPIIEQPIFQDQIKNTRFNNVLSNPETNFTTDNVPSLVDLLPNKQPKFDFGTTEPPFPRWLVENKPMPKDIVSEMSRAGFGDITPETIAQAYNQKDWYHGTGTDNLTPETLDPFLTNHEGLFGQGIYLTDNPEIAKGYAKSRGKQTTNNILYKGRVNVNRVIDLEKPLTEDAKDALQKTFKGLNNEYNEYDFHSLIEDAFKKRRSFEDTFKDIKELIGEHSRDNGWSTNEYVDFFQELLTNMKMNGIDGVTHTGGHRTSHDPHRVLILTDPNDISGTGRSRQVTEFNKHLEGEAARTINKREPFIRVPQTENHDIPSSRIDNIMGSIKEPQKDPIAALPKKTVPEKLREEAQQIREQTAKQPIEDVINTFKKTEITPKAPDERGFINTLANSEKTAPNVLERLKNDLRSRYTKVSNEETVKLANERVQNLEEAHRFVMNADRATPDSITTAHRLIDEYQKRGEFEKAVDVAEKAAELGTKAGQSIQAFSIYNRLSPEGILVHAKRIANKVNEKLPAGSKEVKVTGDMAAQLTDLAGTVQKMQGTSQEANNILNILDRAKKGEKLNDIDTQQIKNFVQDAKKFVKGVDEPKVKEAKQPKEMQDKRVRDKVVSALDKQEQAARERIAKARNRISSTPFDIYADYAIIGASKMAKGVVKFADWAEQMAKELSPGEKPDMQKLYGLSHEKLLESSKKISAETISQAEKIADKMIKNNEYKPEDIETIRNLTGKVSELSGDAKVIASQDLQAVLQQLERPSIGQKVSNFQTIMQLLNPKTMVRNVLGNELFYRVERLNKYITTPLDWGRVKLFGGQRSVTFATGKDAWKTFFNDIGLMGWKDFGKDVKTGAKAGWKGVNPEGLSTQYDIHGRAFNAKWNPMTFLEKATGASLKSFDYASYKRAVNNTLGEMANLDAINRGLKGQAAKTHIEQYMRNADENLTSIADQYGKYVTFQDDNVLSKGFSAVKRGLNFKKDFGLGDLVLKYPRTPANLLMRAIEYSPAGFLRSAYIAAKPWLNKSAAPNTAEAMMALSRAITGTIGFTGLGYYLAEKGIITGQADKDKDIRELDAMSGGGQYRVNWDALKRWISSGFDDKQAKIRTDDKLISYDWAQPISMALSMGANISQSFKDHDMKAKKSKKEVALNALDAAYNSVSGAANTLVDQSLLKGIQQLFQTSPGGNGVMDSLANMAKNAPASFIPTLLNQIKQVNDNTGRMTNAQNGVDEMLNKIKNKTPGLSNSLPVAYDTFGKPKKTYQDPSLFNIFLNPAFTSNYQPSKEAQMVSDLIEKTGDKNLAPRAVGPGGIKNFTIKGNKYELTPEEMSQAQRIMGEETLQRLQKLNPNAKQEYLVKTIKDILTRSEDKAKIQIEKQHPEIKKQKK